MVSCHYHLRNGPTCMPSQAAEHSSPAICDKTFASHRPSCQPFSATRRVRSQKVGDQKKRGEFEPQPSQNIWKRCFFLKWALSLETRCWNRGKQPDPLRIFDEQPVYVYMYIYMYTYIYIYVYIYMNMKGNEIHKIFTPS